MSFPTSDKVNAEDGGLDQDGAILPRLKAFVGNVAYAAIAKLEGQCIVIVGKKLVETTYQLEGDSILSVVAFDMIMALKADFDTHMDDLSWPGMDDAIEECARACHIAEPDKYPADDDGSLGNLRLSLKARIRCIVMPSRTYFETTIIGTLAPMIELLKICRLVNPYRFSALKPTLSEFRAAVNSLDFFEPDVVNAICVGFSDYVRLANELPPLPADHSLDDKLKAIKTFWRANAVELKPLSPFVRYCFTIQCSSAAVERVFSILKNCFGDRQTNSLEDYVCLSLMRQYNKRANM
jgi:hypothetical protein